MNSKEKKSKYEKFLKGEVETDKYIRKSVNITLYKSKQGSEQLLIRIPRRIQAHLDLTEKDLFEFIIDKKEPEKNTFRIIKDGKNAKKKS